MGFSVISIESYGISFITLTLWWGVSKKVSFSGAEVFKIVTKMNDIFQRPFLVF